MKFSKRTFGVFSAALAALFPSAATASAQVEIPSQSSIQRTGLFTKSSDGSGIRQEATKSGGFLVGYSYQISRWAGVEGNYGFSRNTQNYSTTVGTNGVQADLHQFTGAFVVHIPVHRLRVRPYALSGSGALLFDPTDNVCVGGAARQPKPAFLYGGGVNFDVSHRIGVRTEYRGFVYQTPDFGLSSLNLDKYTHLAQPSVGVYFRF